MTPLTDREQNFKNSVFRMIAFPRPVLQEFYDYWSEPNKSGSKMRWELEKTWDLKRRLTRWAANSKVEIKPEKPVEQDKTIAFLNERLSQYAKHPTEVSNESLMGLYDWMKVNGVLKLNQDQVKIAREAGPEKGKGIAVKFFFENLMNKNKTFSDILKPVNGR